LIYIPGKSSCEQERKRRNIFSIPLSSWWSLFQIERMFNILFSNGLNRGLYVLETFPIKSFLKKVLINLVF